MSRTDEPAALRPKRNARARAPEDAPRPERVLAGMPISGGIAIGPVFGAAEPATEVVRRSIEPDDVPTETARLDAAIVQSRKQLTNLRARLGVLPEDSQAEIAPLIDA